MSEDRDTAAWTKPDAAAPPEATDIPYRAEVWRKAIHLLALVVPLGMALLGKAWALAVLVPLALAAVSADALRVRSDWFAQRIQRVFGPLMRHEERPALGEPVTINGATWVLLSAMLLTLIFPIRIAVPAFVMFMLSDAAAALVGRRFGRHRWPGSRRTLEGSLAFLGCGLVIMALFPSVVFWTAAVSVVAAMGAEVLRGPFNDNLRVPLVAATVLFLLERFVLGLDVTLFFVV